MGERLPLGEATENAIVNEALDYGIDKDELYTKMPRINEISFDSERKLMTTIHKIGKRYRIITKGAPDVLINRCNKYYHSGEIKELNSAINSEKITKWLMIR